MIFKNFTFFIGFLWYGTERFWFFYKKVSFFSVFVYFFYFYINLFLTSYILPHKDLTLQDNHVVRVCAFSKYITKHFFFFSKKKINEENKFKYVYGMLYRCCMCLLILHSCFYFKMAIQVLLLSLSNMYVYDMFVLFFFLNHHILSFLYIQHQVQLNTKYIIVCKGKSEISRKKNFY